MRSAHGVIFSSLLVTFVLATPLAYAQATVLFDIPAQPLADSLRMVGHQTHINVLFDPPLVDGLRAPALKASLTPDQAFTQLLVGTALKHRFLDDKTVTITSASASGTSTETDQSQHSTAGDAQSAAKEGEKRNSSDTFRMAQMDQTAPGPGPVEAQQAATQRTPLEEIVVTAQKKSERLLDVPIPVTAVSAEQLLNNNQLRLQDYFTSVPGLSVTPNVASNQVLSIRGITTGGGTNPTVGVTIDDVPVGSSTNLGGGLVVPDIDPGDLERIEVLRGPQGTLYGASSMGGLLKFVTVDPTIEGVSGRIQAGVEGVHNGDQAGYSVRGSANVPLADAFAFRVSGFARRDPGYIDNSVLNLQGLNKTDVYGGRLAGLWTLSDNISVKFSALLQESKGDGSADVDLQPGLGDLQQNYVRGIGGYNRKTQAYSLTFKAKAGAGDFTAISGYSVNEFHDSWDYSYLYGSFAQALFGVGGSPVFDDNRTGKFTQEVRYSLPLGARVTWLLGGFYTHESSKFIENLDALDPTTGQDHGRILNLSFPTTYKEYAGFTDVTLQITDRLDIQLGGRESHIKQTFVEYSGDVTAVPQQNTNANAFTYLLTPRFRLSPDFMIYARFASGYRAGGANGVPGQPTQYDPDKTLNYELGLKKQFAERGVSLEAALFYIDWKDIQVQLLDSTSGLSYTVNGNRAKSQGLEVSLEARPFKGTTLSTWFVFDDAQLSQNFPANSSAYGVDGERLPYGSRFSDYFSLDQEFPLTSQVSGFTGAALSYIGNRLGIFGPAGSTPPPRQEFGGYARLDVKAGARFPSWTTNLFVNNVTDRRGALTGGIGYTPPFAFVYIQPRTFGVSVIRTF